MSFPSLAVPALRSEAARAMLFYLLICSCALLFSACGSPALRAGSQGSARAQATSGATLEPASAQYGTDVWTKPVRGDAADEELEGALRAACKDAGLTPDGRLAELAQKLAAISDGARRAPGYAQVSYYAHRVGLVEPTPELWLAGGPSTPALLGALRTPVHDAARASRLSHCGAAALRSDGGVVLAVALSARHLTLEGPIARRLEVGGEVALQGKLARDYEKPLLAITDPRGHVERITLPHGTSFSRGLRFDSQGEYTVELLAQGPDGVTVVALFPLAVGVAEAEAPEADEGPGEENAEDVAQKLAELIAREREQRKLAPLRVDLALARVALLHSQDMVQHGFIAHTSKTTGDAPDRVARAGLVATLVLENIGRGYSANEIHQGLMESPGHRGNILNADARELGIGVVAEPEGDRLAFVATEVFTKLAQAVDPKQAPQKLSAAVNAQRRRAHRSAVTLDEELSRVAQQAADRFVSGEATDDNALLDQATRSVKRPPRGTKALAAALVLADDLEQVWDSPRLTDPNLIALGVGVAKLKPTEKHRIAVVLLLGLRK